MVRNIFSMWVSSPRNSSNESFPSWFLSRILKNPSTSLLNSCKYFNIFYFKLRDLVLWESEICNTFELRIKLLTIIYSYIVVGTPALLRTLNHSSLVMKPLLSLSAARKYFLNWKYFIEKQYKIDCLVLFNLPQAFSWVLLSAPPLLSSPVCTLFVLRCVLA